MTLTQSNEPDQPSSSTVSITVLSVTPARAKKLFAFASVEIDIDGVQIGVHGIRAMRELGGTAIELPKFRDAGGVWRTAITLPEEVRSPIAKAVFDELVERAQRAVRGVGAQDLRDSGALRQRVGAELSRVQTALDDLLVDRPRRRILRQAPVSGGA